VLGTFKDFVLSIPSMSNKQFTQGKGGTPCSLLEFADQGVKTRDTIYPSLCERFAYGPVSLEFMFLSRS
jgi:hypothetical protein